MISAFAPCVSYLNIRLGSKTTGGFYLLFICLFACELLIFCRLFIYLIIYLFMFAIYWLSSCGHSLFYLFIYLFVFYNLGGSHFLLSLQPTTAGVILYLYIL